VQSTGDGSLIILDAVERAGRQEQSIPLPGDFEFDSISTAAELHRSLTDAAHTTRSHRGSVGAGVLKSCLSVHPHRVSALKVMKRTRRGVESCCEARDTDRD